MGRRLKRRWKKSSPPSPKKWRQKSPTRLWRKSPEKTSKNLLPTSSERRVTAHESEKEELVMEEVALPEEVSEEEPEEILPEIVESEELEFESAELLEKEEEHLEEEIISPPEVEV